MSTTAKDKDLTKEIVEYDFRKTKDVSHDKVASLQIIFDAFSQKVASFLSAKLSATVQTRVLSVTQSPYADFVKTIQVPTLIGIIDINPLKGLTLIEISPNLIFNFIDRLLGGKGEIVSLTRGLTDIELEVVENIVTDLAKGLKAAWANVIELNPVLKKIESNPQFAQITSPKETVIIGTIEVKAGETTGNMTLCLPLLMIEPLISKFTGERESSLPGGAEQPVSSEDIIKMRKVVENIIIPLVVELGRTEVTMRDMLELKEGDVVRLNGKVDDVLIMYAEGIPKFRCRPGVVGIRMAAQITQRIG
ncbi:MAG: flagellar motor switch protein FliM [bacterium]|nr:flagellar motor switch protein FliM [bacterium]